MVYRQVCCQCPHNGSLGMPDLKNHWFTERLAFLGQSLMGHAVWKRKVEVAFPRLASNPRLKVVIGQRVKYCFSSSAVRSFKNFSSLVFHRDFGILMNTACMMKHVRSIVKSEWVSECGLLGPR